MKNTFSNMKIETKITFLLFFIVINFGCNNLFNSNSIDLIPYKSGDKYGYLDIKGAIVINPQFLYASMFVDNLALIQASDGKYGYINKEGKFVINPIYVFASDFSEGLACVVRENSKPEYIDEDGNIKFALATAEYAGVFNEKLAAIKVDSKWGYINDDGEIKINPIYDFCYPFSNGMAAVMQINEKTKEESWGFINTSGELVINFQFKSVEKNGFNDDIAVVFDGKNYGGIDKSGKYLINPQFEELGQFNNGLAPAKKGELYGFIDKTGKIIINPQFDFVGNFSDNGLAKVKSSDGKWGYIDKDGKYIINPQFDYAENFISDISFIMSGSKWGIIDSKGKYIANPQYDYIEINTDNLKFQRIESDFFDADLIAKELIGKVDPKMFRGLTGNNNLKSIIVNSSLLFNSGNSMVEDIKKSIGRKAELRNIIYFFGDDLISYQPTYSTREMYNYFKGGYYTEQYISGYGIVENGSSILSGMRMKVLVEGENKCINLKDRLVDALVKQCKLTKSKDDKYTVLLEGNNLLASISVGENEVIIAIAFDKIYGKGMVYSNLTRPSYDKEYYYAKEKAMADSIAAAQADSISNAASMAADQSY